MSRYTLAVDGREFTVEVEDEGPGRFRVLVDGQPHAVALQAESATDVGGLQVTPLGGAVASTAPAAAPATAPATAPAAVAAPAPGPVPSPAAAGPAAGLVCAPMPGVILQVLVAPGARVHRGQALAVLEAMKMENQIRAPADGRIDEVFVQPGAQLAHGAPILRLGQAAP